MQFLVNTVGFSSQGRKCRALDPSSDAQENQFTLPISQPQIRGKEDLNHKAWQDGKTMGTGKGQGKGKGKGMGKGMRMEMRMGHEQAPGRWGPAARLV